jgi:Zn-finger in ubiquitin-hydrolases and other protein
MGLFRRRRKQPAPACTHLDAIREVEPDADGCSECLALGDAWFHLRMCTSCGHVGCCDSSKNRHATRHANAAAHPIMRSFEPGESWMWCVVDRTYVDGA